MGGIWPRRAFQAESRPSGCPWLILQEKLFPLPSPPSARTIDRNCFEGRLPKLATSHMSPRNVAVRFLHVPFLRPPGFILKGASK